MILDTPHLAPMTPARCKAFAKIKREYVHVELKRATESILRRADEMYGGEPLRAAYRVAIKKPRAYYEAAALAVHLLINYSYMLLMKSTDLLQELNKRVQARLGPDAKVDKTYWYKPLTAVQLKQITGYMGIYDFKPLEHNQLNLIADLLRAGPSCADGTHDRPTGGNTSNGTVRFLSRSQVQLFGNSRTIRWKRGKPYIRNTDNTEPNLFTLLEGAGVDKGTVELWMDNAEVRLEQIRQAAAKELQRQHDLTAFNELPGTAFESDDPEDFKVVIKARKAEQIEPESDSDDVDWDLLPELGYDD